VDRTLIHLIVPDASFRYMGELHTPYERLVYRETREAYVLRDIYEWMDDRHWSVPSLYRPMSIMEFMRTYR
jgi:hypothetical protein